jgi:alpha-L-rhamnosidase
MAMNIAEKTAVMLDVVGKHDDARFARSEAEKYKEAIRANLLDCDSMTIEGNCQTSQALGLYYHVFNSDERERAFAKLLDMVHEADDHIDVGVLGGRVIFHVLSEFGYADLAFKMITREDYPSFGNWVKRGATTMWENFHPTSVLSMNHHFWGDISAWFIKAIAGIVPNPSENNVRELKIAPNFIEALTHASAYHVSPFGKICSAWKRDGENVILELKIPEEMHAVTTLPLGYSFENGKSEAPVTSGAYKIIKTI